MNPYKVTPDACIALFFILLIAVYIESYILCIVVGIAFVILAYYVRGSDRLPVLDMDIVCCPCDGMVADVYCEKRRYTYLTLTHAVHYSHGFYAPATGELIDITQKGNDLKINMLTSSGVITMQIQSKHIPMRIFVTPGKVVEQGQLLGFMPTAAIVNVKLPLHETHVDVKEGTELTAGALLGRLQHVWA